MKNIKLKQLIIN